MQARKKIPLLLKTTKAFQGYLESRNAEVEQKANSIRLDHLDGSIIAETERPAPRGKRLQDIKTPSKPSQTGGNPEENKEIDIKSVAATSEQPDLTSLSYFNRETWSVQLPPLLIFLHVQGNTAPSGATQARFLSAHVN
jgi:hypothetical protein